jgi:hypothetical protein
MTTSTDSRKLAIRAAAKIHERLLASPRLDCVDRLPGGGWERLRSAVWRHRKVDVRGWHAAAASLVADRWVRAMSRIAAGQYSRGRRGLGGAGGSSGSGFGGAPKAGGSAAGGGGVAAGASAGGRGVA